MPKASYGTEKKTYVVSFSRAPKAFCGGRCAALWRCNGAKKMFDGVDHIESGKITIAQWYRLQSLLFLIREPMEGVYQNCNRLQNELLLVRFSIFQKHCFPCIIVASEPKGLSKLSGSAKALVNHTQIVLKNPLLPIACDRPIQDRAEKKRKALVR